MSSEQVLLLLAPEVVDSAKRKSRSKKKSSKKSSEEQVRRSIGCFMLPFRRRSYRGRSVRQRSSVWVCAWICRGRSRSRMAFWRSSGSSWMRGSDARSRSR